MNIELYEEIEKLPKDGWFQGCIFCFTITAYLVEFKTSLEKYDAHVCKHCQKDKFFNKNFPIKCTGLINKTTKKNTAHLAEFFPPTKRLLPISAPPAPASPPPPASSLGSLSYSSNCSPFSAITLSSPTTTQRKIRR